MFAGVMTMMLILVMIPAGAFAAGAEDGSDIVILFSSGVRGRADSNMGYAGLAAYANQMRAEGSYVTLVDGGNSLSGSVLSEVSQGAYSVDAMNIVGYDVAVPGVYDFDFGLTRLTDVLAGVAEFPYVSCNMVRTGEGTTVFKPYHIISYGGKKIAYIGISDPETAVKSSSTFGEAYHFCSGNNGQYLYDQVQAAVDGAVREGADYIIAIAHLSSNPLSPYSASSVIKNTTGIHAMIQGNSDTAASAVKLQDAAGSAVLLSSAGNGLKTIGVLTVKSNQTMEAKLIKDYNLQDLSTRDKLSTLQAMYNAELNAGFAETSSLLEAVSDSGDRTIDKGETNLGDLVADAYRNAAGSDIALVESSELKANLKVGELTYRDVMRVLPEGKEISVMEVTGADLMDALEMSARLYPNANGGFLQVSGLTYDIQETVIPSVSLDGFGRFTGVSGEYRVTNIMVDGKPLDLFATYTVAGTHSLLSGDTGYSMLRNGMFAGMGVSTDQLAVIRYFTGPLQGSTGGFYAKSQGRVDSIRLARQSELDQAVEERLSGQIKGYEDRIAQLEKELEEKEEILAVRNLKVTASSQYGKTSGKRYIKITWKTDSQIKGMKYQVYKSTKRNSGYEKVRTASNMYYKNTAGLQKGKTYYYKVRGFKTIGGKTYYTDWSNVAYRTVKS